MRYAALIALLLSGCSEPRWLYQGSPPQWQDAYYTYDVKHVVK